MKAKIYILLLCIAGVSLAGCNDDFMQKFPETSISHENFFNTVNDLDTYVNKLYDQVGYSYDDVFSDNISVYTGGSQLDELLRGNVDENNVGGWTKDNWGNLRNINFMLVNTGKVKGSEEDINHYVGIARLLRARFYYGMVKKYGDMPWYSKPLETSDIDLLMKTQDPRALVVDSIMADLEFAAKYIKPISSRTRFNKYAALQELARIALYEGTYRKYHAELSAVSTADTYFNRAVTAAQSIMESDQFEITGSGAAGYRALFCSGDLSKNKEMIMYRDFDKALGVTNNSHAVYDWQWSLSKSLADSYLTLDGKPATADPAYATKGYVDMFTNRDPRMGETIIAPDTKLLGSSIPSIGKVTYGSLSQFKFYPSQELYGGWDLDLNDIPLYRYAETLLIYAEAKAELGTITQSDLDKTINLIRNRVGMPYLLISTTIDPVLEAAYPNVTGATKALILEVRRERRIELACEGFRWDDIKRWAVGELMTKPFEGAYVSKLGAHDMTGDGIPDIAILRSPNDLEPLAGLSDEIKGKLVYYYLFSKDGKQETFYLSQGDKGNIRFTKDLDNPRTFASPKYYYFPLPFDQLRDNPNLKQPVGWAK